jgi:hypothetical protein
VGAARAIEDRGRSDLAAIIAENLVRSADTPIWSKHSTNLTHVSHALRLARRLDEETIKIFLDSFVDSAWLDRNYKLVRTGMTAGALMSLATYVPQSLQRRFDRPILIEMLRDDIGRVGGDTPPSVAPGLNLLGALVAIGYDVGDMADLNWPSQTEIEDCIATWNRISKGVLGTYELQFWLGVRAMVPWRSDALQLPAHECTVFLHRLGRAEAPSERGATISAELRVWLEAVRSNRWIVTN